MYQSAHVFGKTTAAITGTGEKELKTEALILPDATAHIADVGLQAFKKIGKFVDEAALGGAHGIVDVFRHLGTFGRDDEEWTFGTQERLIKLVQAICGRRVADAGE